MCDVSLCELRYQSFPIKGLYSVRNAARAQSGAVSQSVSALNDVLVLERDPNAIKRNPCRGVAGWQRQQPDRPFMLLCVDDGDDVERMRHSMNTYIDFGPSGYNDTFHFDNPTVFICSLCASPPPICCCCCFVCVMFFGSLFFI